MTWYKVRTDPEIILSPGETRMKPLATFSDDQSSSPNLSRMHIICDDKQLVLVQERGGISKMTQWWPPEVVREAGKSCVKLDNDVSAVRVNSESLEDEEVARMTTRAEMVLRAAEILNDRHADSMMSTGQGFDFYVNYDVSTDHVALALGSHTLWDDEDENDGKFDVDDIVSYAQGEINALVRMFAAILKED